MHAGDWRDIDFVQICERRITLLDALWEQFPQRGVGHGEYVGIGRFFAPFVKAKPGELTIFDLQAAYGSAQNHLPAAALDLRLASIVQICERNGGDSHAIAGAVRKKGFPENVDAEACVGASKFLIESAHEDDAPESLDGVFRLAAAAEPLQHGDPTIFQQVRWLTFGPQNIEHGARDG